MTDAQTILHMIETVDPADTAKLDEIDARVWAYVNGLGRNVEWHRSDVHCLMAIAKDWQHPKWKKILTFTRSRDALKDILPEKWAALEVAENFLGESRCKLYVYNKAFENPHCSMRAELAMLHAIIQAIAYERGEK